MSTLTFTVNGLPAPQGSKRYLGNGVMVESSKRVKSWRADVRAAAVEAFDGSGGALHPWWDTPIHVELVFTMPRPKSHYRTGRNAGLLRDGAPAAPTGRPDLDKLTRAVWDALTGIVWADDSHVVEAWAWKRYADRDRNPGLDVTVTEAT